jgi:hypothetical protein
MQLNESTYETIFLLYIDNELSPKERLEVEAFIADNPSYALKMEALQATVASAELIEYPFKENLKQQDWEPTYSTIIKEDLQAIPGLSTSFKNALKKDTAKEGIIVKPFGFNQNKLTYAAIAACLMVFLGYQQLTKTPASNLIVASTKTEMLPSEASSLVRNEISNASPKTNQPAKTIQEVTTKLEASNSSRKQGINVIQQESIAMTETTSNIESLNNQAVSTKLPSNFNDTPLPISSANVDIEPTEVEKGLPNYEIIDTEDPSRTIFIANFEIDGAAFRGITRRVSALLKRNKSEKEK